MIQLVNIILIFFGIGLMFPKSFSISEKSELRRPRNIFFGIILIIGTLLAQTLSSLFFTGFSYFSVSWLLAYAVPIILALASIVFLKQPKIAGVSAVAQNKSSADRIATVIFWIIIGVIGLGFLYIAVKSFILK